MFSDNPYAPLSSSRRGASAEKKKKVRRRRRRFLSSDIFTNGSGRFLSRVKGGGLSFEHVHPLWPDACIQVYVRLVPIKRKAGGVSRFLRRREDCCLMATGSNNKRKACSASRRSVFAHEIERHRIISHFRSARPRSRKNASTCRFLPQRAD